MKNSDSGETVHQSPEPTPVTVGPQSRVSLGTVGTVLLVMAGAFGTAHAYWRSIYFQLSAIERRLERIEERSGDRWSWTDMSIWVERARASNPEVTFPDPDPVRFPPQGRKSQ